MAGRDSCFVGRSGTCLWLDDQGLLYGGMIRNYVRTIRFGIPTVTDFINSTTIHHMYMPTGDKAVLASGKSDAYKMV
jgi:hypothetical protein